MTKGPLPRYRQLVAEGRLESDPAQRAAIEKLQLLSRRLARGEVGRRRGGWLGAFRFSGRGGDETQGGGIYLYGGVGRGKSMLMDIFYETAPDLPKRRVHFHAFMQEAHAAIHEARSKGVDDPVPPTLTKMVGGLSLLCFDEMQVTDITDAMLLGRLFEGFFARDIAIVVTSNRHPATLYENGLNRDLFLPAIDLLCQKLDVHHLDGPMDYRLARLRGAEVYYTPLGPEATAAMDAAWEEVAAGVTPRPLTLPVQGREVTLPAYANGAARATFDALCVRPLGPADYLAIADAVRMLFIDDIPTLSRARNNEAKRFVTLIDALYEAKVHLVCSAAAAPEALYVEGEGSFEFQRTASRLNEMRSADWTSGAA